MLSVCRCTVVFQGVSARFMRHRGRAGQNNLFSAISGELSFVVFSPGRPQEGMKNNGCRFGLDSCQPRFAVLCYAKCEMKLP